MTARNTITQILQGPEMQMTTRIDVSRMVDGQRSGLALFGVRPSWIGAVREGGHTRIVLANRGTEFAGPAVSRSTIDLAARVGPEQTVVFSYSLDGGKRFAPFGAGISACALLVVEGIAAGTLHFHARGRGRLDRRRLVRVNHGSKP